MPGKFIQTELEEQGLYSLHSSTSVCKDKSYMVVIEKLSKMLQIGDQRLCQNLSNKQENQRFEK